MAEEPLEITTSKMRDAAGKIRTPITAEKPGPANPPDGLIVTATAMSQLQASAERMLATLGAGDTENQRLSEAFESTAQAFRSFDEEWETEFKKRMNGGPDAPTGATTIVPTPVSTPAPILGEFPYPTSAVKCGDDFGDWRIAARTIHAGDTKASSLNYMRDQWKKYQGEIKSYVNKLPTDSGLNGGGSAEEACKNAMKSLRGWWGDMGRECERLTTEIERLIDAHDTLVREHPTDADADEFDGIDWRNFIPGAKAAEYLKFQRKSEEALAAYSNSAKMNPIRPGKPPTINGSPTTKTDGPTSGKSDTAGQPTDSSPTPNTATPTTASPVSAKPSSGEQSSGSPSGGSPSGGSPSGGGSPSSGGSPSGSGMPSGMPEGMPEMPGLEDPSLKPASAGGGMGGGGGGMGAGPLGPSVGAETVAASPAGARGAAGPAAAPSGGGMGGMGGGMGGMGGGHGQQGKEKRRDPKLAEDEDLYIEDRAYTEGVIGRRARRDVKDGKQ